MHLWQRKDVDFYANIDLPNFNYFLFYYRRSKIVWPNEKEDIFVLISNDLLYCSLRLVKRSLYDSLRFRLSVLSDVAFSIQTYKNAVMRNILTLRIRRTARSRPLTTETGFKAVLPPVPRRYFCCGSLLFLLSVFILWFNNYVSDIFCKF